MSDLYILFEGHVSVVPTDTVLNWRVSIIPTNHNCYVVLIPTLLQSLTFQCHVVVSSINYFYRLYKKFQGYAQKFANSDTSSLSWECQPVGGKGQYELLHISWKL